MVREDEPQARAEELLHQARTEPDGGRRVELARAALNLWPDCAAAHVLLAEHAPSRRAAVRLYEQAVAAGERAMGAEAFQRDSGHFWAALPTRPYMHARLGLAQILWTVGRREEAVRHLQDLLRLNPDDNQGVRYTLAAFLLFLDRDEDLAALLQQYPAENSAAWAYTRALLRFRREGDSLEARQLLKTARKANKHVPDYLLGRKFPPPGQPGFYSPGQESEALEYLSGFLGGWKSTPGAIAWLRVNDAKGKKRKPAARQPTGPGAAGGKKIREKLPQQDDVWQADLGQMSNWIRGDGQPVRPWLLLVASDTHDFVLAHEVTEEKPSAELLWDTLVRAMQHPAAGRPHRPRELQVRPDESWERLRPHLDEMGVNLVVAEKLERIEGMLEGLNARLAGGREPGLLDVPGVTPERVGSFYAAAAEFYRQAPWKKVGYEAAIRVECDRVEGGPWYAVLMGQSGLTTGLTLYQDLRILRTLWAREATDEENAREAAGTTVLFGEEWETPVADAAAARKYGWQLARPDAYPAVFHKDRGLSLRPPQAWELDLLDAFLRSVPEFVSRRPQEDPTPEEVVATVAAGELRLRLSWVPEEAAPEHDGG